MSDGQRKSTRTGLPDYPILDDHKRDRKKLIPPMMSLTGMQSVSTLDTILPEIIWVGLVIDRYGLRRGINLVTESLKNLWSYDEITNWYRFSEICKNPEGFLRGAGEKNIVQMGEVFSSFKEVYDWEDLGWSSSSLSGLEHRDRIVRTVSKCADRFGQPYLTILATVIHAMGVSGKMQFPQGALPNIEAIVSDWGTDEAEMAACSLRACSLAFFPHDQREQSDEWCRHFWRVNYSISGCAL